ncbi:MAG: acetyltransferase [Fimbriimonadales bacterium]|nr:MAG: acetyltransferase [Fimbriimonadales bacterium]
MRYYVAEEFALGWNTSEVRLIESDPMLWRRAETEARRITPDESEWFLRVLCSGFGLEMSSARRFFYDDPYFEVNQRWGLWLHEDDHPKLVSVLTAIPLKMRIGVRYADCFGIAGVATLPDYRRRGFAAELLKRALRRLYAEQAPLTILQAFNYEFYRKLGWETVGAAAQARFSPKQLPRYPAHPLRRASPKDHDAVIRFYTDFGVQRTGSLLRDARRWDYLFWNLPNLWVYEHAGRIEGYLFYDFLDSGWTLRVREMVWSSERARRAILSWLASNEESVQQVEVQLPLGELAALSVSGWNAPPVEPSEPFYTVQMLPNFMARPVHAPTLLHTLLRHAPAPDDFVPFNLRLRDRVIVARDNIIGVCVAGDRVELGEPLPHAPMITIAPTAMALLAFGTLGAPELHARRLLNAPESLLPTLDMLFPQRQPCLTPIDYF